MQRGRRRVSRGTATKRGRRQGYSGTDEVVKPQAKSDFDLDGGIPRVTAMFSLFLPCNTTTIPLLSISLQFPVLHLAAARLLFQTQ